MTVPLVLVGVGARTARRSSSGRAITARRCDAPLVRPGRYRLPDFGFDVYRAFVDDVRPFRFDDAAVADLMGRQWVLVDDRVQLATTDAAGLTFQPHGVSNALVVPGGGRRSPSAFPAARGTSTWVPRPSALPLTVEAFAACVSRGAQLLAPGQHANWRTPGLDRVQVTGDGGIALIGYRLVNAPYQWSLLGHRSLPVSDPAYPDSGEAGAGR